MATLELGSRLFEFKEIAHRLRLVGGGSPRCRVRFVPQLSYACPRLFVVLLHLSMVVTHRDMSLRQVGREFSVLLRAASRANPWSSLYYFGVVDITVRSNDQYKRGPIAAHARAKLGSSFHGAFVLQHAWGVIGRTPLLNSFRTQVVLQSLRVPSRHVSSAGQPPRAKESPASESAMAVAISL